MDIRLKRSLRPSFSKSATPATMPGRFKSSVCAIDIQSFGVLGQERVGEVGLSQWVDP
jgi:hypothetical protein